jgi:hypothetical protein
METDLIDYRGNWEDLIIAWIKLEGHAAKNNETTFSREGWRMEGAGRKGWGEKEGGKRSRKEHLGRNKGKKIFSFFFLQYWGLNSGLHLEPLYQPFFVKNFF